MKIELEETCAICNGSSYIKEKKRTYSCIHCEGKGLIPTDFGNQILDFLKSRQPFADQFQELTDKIIDLAIDVSSL